MRTWKKASRMFLAGFALPFVLLVILFIMILEGLVVTRSSGYPDFSREWTDGDGG